MKLLTYDIAVKEGYNKALKELEQIIHESEMDGEYINELLNIIDKMKK